MDRRSLHHLCTVAATTLWLCAGTLTAVAQDKPTSPDNMTKETPMRKQAKGEFEVQMAPQAPDAGHEDAAIGRMLLDKRFHGDLDATSLGQMLAFRSVVENSSAGYVALERVTGKLHGRSGSFVLQHSGTMARGEQSLDLAVVPDSGTEELLGLTGEMTIKIEEGKHFYEFDYSLP